MGHSLRSKAVVNKVDIVRVLADVARALVRLHAAGHIHRDVKAGCTHSPLTPKPLNPNPITPKP